MLFSQWPWAIEEKTNIMNRIIFNGSGFLIDDLEAFADDWHVLLGVAAKWREGAAKESPVAFSPVFENPAVWEVKRFVFAFGSGEFRGNILIRDNVGVCRFNDAARIP